MENILKIIKKNDETTDKEEELGAFGRSTKMRRSPQRSVKEATRADIPDETPGRPNKEEASSSGATDRAEMATPLPCSAPVLEVSSVRNASPEQMDLDTNRVEVHSTVLARAEEERLIRKCAAVVKRMRSATFLQRNVSKGVKNGLMELEELLDRISFYRRTWRAAEDDCRAETVALPAENAACVKRTADSPLQSELGKKRKEDDVPEGDFIEVVSKAQKKKAKKDKKKQRTPSPETRLSKNKEAANPKPVAEKTRKRRRTRPSALLIKPTEGKTFAEVLSEIRYRMKPEENGAEVSSIRKTRSGGVLVELGPKTTNKSTFCEAVKGLLGEKALVSSLEPMCSLEIRDLDCLTEKVEVEEALKRECPEVTNARVGITSVNARGQKLAVVEVPEQYARKLLNSGRIKIGWVVCRVRMRIVPTKCYRCLDYGHTSAACKGPDRRTACRRCGQAGHQAKTCKESESCVLCRDRGASGESVAHTAGSGRCPIFRAELERARVRTP